MKRFHRGFGGELRSWTFTGDVLERHFKPNARPQQRLSSLSYLEPNSLPDSKQTSSQSHSPRFGPLHLSLCPAECPFRPQQQAEFPLPPRAKLFPLPSPLTSGQTFLRGARVWWALSFRHQAQAKLAHNPRHISLRPLELNS